jgi:uncharacterized protein (DUF433 family)
MVAVTVNPKVQGGLPCFTGTRVPVTSLFDHLQRGYTVEQILGDFPTVTREQIDAIRLSVTYCYNRIYITLAKHRPSQSARNSVPYGDVRSF